MIDLMKDYGKRYKVAACPCDGEHHGDQKQWQEIQGKRGYIRLWGEDELELYLTSTHIAARIERLYKHFKPKNHYDDATAFVFKREHIGQACRWIKAKNRRQMTPEALERLSRMRSLLPKVSKKGTLATENPETAQKLRKRQTGGLMRTLILLLLAVPAVAQCPKGYSEYEGSCASEQTAEAGPSVQPSEDKPPTDKLPSYERAGIHADTPGNLIQGDMHIDQEKSDADASGKKAAQIPQ